LLLPYFFFSSFLSYPLTINPDKQARKLKRTTHFWVGLMAQVAYRAEYPVTSGRNFPEMLRLSVSVRLGYHFPRLGTWANWQPGGQEGCVSWVCGGRVHLGANWQPGGQEGKKGVCHDEKCWIWDSFFPSIDCKVSPTSHLLTLLYFSHSLQDADDAEFRGRFVAERRRVRTAVSKGPFPDLFLSSSSILDSNHLKMMICLLYLKFSYLLAMIKSISSPQSTFAQLFFRFVIKQAYPIYHTISFFTSPVL